MKPKPLGEHLMLSRVLRSAILRVVKANSMSARMAILAQEKVPSFSENVKYNGLSSKRSFVKYNGMSSEQIFVHVFKSQALKLYF